MRWLLPSKSIGEWQRYSPWLVTTSDKCACFYYQKAAYKKPCLAFLTINHSHNHSGSRRGLEKNFNHLKGCKKSMKFPWEFESHVSIGLDLSYGHFWKKDVTFLGWEGTFWFPNRLSFLVKNDLVYFSAKSNKPFKALEKNSHWHQWIMREKQNIKSVRTYEQKMLKVLHFDNFWSFLDPFQEDF